MEARNTCSSRVYDSRYLDGNCNRERFYCPNNKTEEKTLYDEYVDISDSKPHYDVVELASLFKKHNFDPVNAIGPFDNFELCRDEYHRKEDRMEQVYEYLKAPQFVADVVLRTRLYDHVVHAIYSFFLYFSVAELRTFAKQYPKFNVFCKGLETMQIKERQFVYVAKFAPNIKVPFIRCAFKLLLDHFNFVDNVDVPCSYLKDFNIRDYVTAQDVSDFRRVYSHLLSSSMDAQDIEQLQEHHAALIDVKDEFKTTVNRKLRVITGQACTGKTTLLRKICAKSGCSVKSRQDLGTFAGKSHSPTAIALLHAAMENGLSHSNVIGDRGPIDNPLWCAIMNFCDSKHTESLIDDLLRFFNGNFNEHAVAYMSQRQNVVVFLDPYPECNRERMLARSKGGDVYRARIYMYPITQFMAYYMAARLFGWKVCCVPYNDQREFSPGMYDGIADQVLKYFQYKRSDLRDSPGVPCKPANICKFSNEYPKAVGIFK